MKVWTLVCLVMFLTGCLHRMDNECQYWGKHSVSGRLVQATYDRKIATASGEFVMPEVGEREFRCAATYECSQYPAPETAKNMGANAIFEGTGPVNMCTGQFTYNVCHIEFFSDACPDRPAQ